MARPTWMAGSRARTGPWQLEVSLSSVHVRRSLCAAATCVVMTGAAVSLTTVSAFATGGAATDTPAATNANGGVGQGNGNGNAAHETTAAGTPATPASTPATPSASTEADSHVT